MPPHPYYPCLIGSFVAAGMAIATSMPFAIAAADPVPTRPPSNLAAQNWVAQRGINNRTDFFDQGQEQFNQEINRLQQQPPDPLLTVDTAAGRWQPFLSKAGNFSIWMPPGTLTEETKTMETAVGPLSFNVTASNSRNGRSVVAYSNLPASATESPDQILTAVRDRLQSRTPDPLVSDRAVSLKSYPGRELSFKGANEVITIRYFLVQNRLYLMGVQSSGGMTSTMASTFFNSFQLQ